jgi:hypothetical protein
MRVVQMPYVSWDSQKSRAVYQRRYPKDVRLVLGDWFRHKYPGSLSQRQAEAISHEQTAEFNARVDAARARLYPAHAEGRVELSGADLDAFRNDLDQTYAKGWRTRTNATRYLDKQRELEKFRQMAAELGIELPKQPVTRGSYTFNQCIDELWIPKRRRDGKSVAEKTVAKLVRSKTDRLVAHLGHDDMNRITRNALEGYFDSEFTDAALGTLRDHILMIKALFALAHDREKITDNPAKRITYSKDNSNPGRPFWPSERDAILRAAWDCEDDTIRWLWTLGCVYGPRVGEFGEASVRDVVVEDGVPILILDTLHRKGAQKTLKTADSKRWLPIHSAMRAEFMARVERLRKEHGENSPLFPDLRVYDGRRNKDASNRVNNWMHKLVAAGTITISCNSSNLT